MRLKKLILVFITSFCYMTTLFSQIIVNDSFTNINTLNNWNINSVGNGGTAVISAGSLVMSTNGGSNGYSGNADIHELIANYQNMPTDFTNKSIEFNISEINRFSNASNNEWVKFWARIGTDSNSLNFVISGNWDKNDYQGSPTQAHRLDIYQTINGNQTNLNTINLNLYQLYIFDVKFINNSGLWMIEYYLNGFNTVVNSTFNVSTNISFGYRIWSGDGGFTVSNGGGSYQTDYFIVRGNCSNNTFINPQTSYLLIGNTATLTASTSDLNPSYVWQSDLGQGFQTLNNFGNYSGVNTATLNIANVQLPNHTQPIRAISTSGNCIDTSNVAIINILDTCITNVTIYDTLLTTVSDTLVINTQITGNNPPNNLNTLKVFPNPASTHITIDYGNFNAMSGYTLTIVNSIGQTVFTTPINQQTSYIDLSTWTGNGIYFVQLIDPQNNTIENRKIVIQ